MANEIPIDLVMRVRDEMSAALDRVSKEIGGVSSSADRMTGEVDDAGKELGDYAKSANTASNASSGFSAKLAAVGQVAGQLAMEALRTLGNAIGDVVGSMIRGNAEMERYETQFGVLLGSTSAAKERLKELADFGARTPFELPEVVRADKILQGFGLHSQESAKKFGLSGEQIRTLAGDMAAGTGTSFEDMATYLGKFASGSTGEVISRFQELGITTREELARMGLQFSKSGELTTPAAQAFTVLAEVAKNKFGGMMDAQSKTFEGMMSNLTDWKDQTLRTIGEPIFEVLKDKLGNLLEFLSRPETKAAIETFAKELADTIGKVVTWVEENWPKIQATIETVSTKISEIWNGVLKPIIDFAIQKFTDFYNNTTTNMDGIGDKVDRIMTFVGGVVKDVLDKVKGFWDANGEDIKKFVGDAWDKINSIITTVMDIIVTLIDKYLPYLQKQFDIWLAWLQIVFQTAWDVVKLVVGNALDVLNGIVKTVLALINGDVDGALASLKEMFGNVWERIKNTVTDWLGKVRDIINEYLGKQGTSIEQIYNGIVDKIKTAWTNIYNSVEYWVNTVKNRVAAIWQEMKDDTILKFNQMMAPIKAAFNEVIRLYNTAAGYLGLTQIQMSNRPSSRGSSLTSPQAAASTANVTVNVYGGDASMAERGTVLALRRAGFSVR